VSKRGQGRGKRGAGKRAAGPAIAVVVTGGTAPVAPKRKQTRRVTNVTAAQRNKWKSGQGLLVSGLLVVGGAAAAIKLDTMVSARPMGLPPSAIALVGAVAVAVGANYYKRPNIARASASLAIGIATGMVASKLAGPGGSTV